MEVILASQSPRRKALMELFHIPFRVLAADIDETMDPKQDPAVQTAQISLAKALATPHAPEDIVIAADTIVVCDGQILGKPKDEADAQRMLRLLSGRTHQVMTGLAVLYPGGQQVETQITQIHFRELTDREILAYIRTGEPMDKAGAYGIQGGAALFADTMTGDYYNVMGLPVCRLGQILRQAAPEIMEGPQ